MFLDVSGQNTTENTIVQSGKNRIKSELNVVIFTLYSP